MDDGLTALPDIPVSALPKAGEHPGTERSHPEPASAPHQAGEHPVTASSPEATSGEDRFHVTLTCDLPEQHYLLHRPAREDCPTCRAAKQRRKAARPVEDVEDFATDFGGRISFDHAIIGKHQKGISGFKTALHIDDEASNFQMFVPAPSKSAHEVEQALRMFIGSDIEQVQELYSDNAPEYIRVAKNLKLPSRNSTPRRPTSNARKERKMQTFGDSVACALHQAAIPIVMWPLAGQYICNANNFYGEEDSPYYWRYGELPSATLAPFGSRVTVVPPPELQEKFAPRAWECLFLGYSLIVVYPYIKPCFFTAQLTV